ncbi:uncharacterized protein LOC113204685 [Frankliniella occidentalis]|uniref:Uncharacterized protein LOC113204685 n=1 Tax=Frankliniella occidentalis TaxID=133901 RepID=A0A9C6WZM2_FRAOC|nr:uncharacterized protein LOC113204685 [Frankliniella occidentalis]
MGKTKAVLLWSDTEQVSIEDLSVINDEDRYHGACSTVKSGNKIQRVVVKFISSDELKLQEEESKVLDEIEIIVRDRVAQNVPGQRKSRSRKAVVLDGTATNNQVAFALGERKKPSGQQLSKKKKIEGEKKLASQAHRDAQDTLDRAAAEPISRRELFASDDEAESNDETDESAALFYSDEENMDSTEGPINGCCQHCVALRKAYTQSGALFVRTLANFASISAGVGTKFAELRPIPSDRACCEVTKGSKVFITNADKNAIKSEYRGDPAKMTRATLVSLYGRDLLERQAVTARGSKQGTLGIPKRIRDAVRAFVNRNKGEAYPVLNEANFNRIINKQRSAIHRVRGSKRTPAKEQLLNSSPLRLQLESAQLPASPLASSNLVNINQPQVSNSPLAPSSLVNTNSNSYSPHQSTPSGSDWHHGAQHYPGYNQNYPGYYPPHQGLSPQPAEPSWFNQNSDIPCLTAL